LNIERDATEDQVREAYRSLAVALHPDKHLEPSAKTAAQSRFREVQRAYEVLSDREKRSVYDYFGEEGLTSSWTISTRGRTPEELRAEFERQKMGRRSKEVDELVKSKGEYTAQIDATSMFAPAKRVMRPPNRAGTEVTVQDRWNGLKSGQLVGKHGFSMQITERIALGFTGQMVSRRGMGSGNLIGTLKTQWSPKLSFELSTTLMAPQLAVLKTDYTLNEFT
jgi:DnaJ family protein C protein 11